MIPIFFIICIIICVIAVYFSRKYYRNNRELEMKLRDEETLYLNGE